MLSMDRSDKNKSSTQQSDKTFSPGSKSTPQSPALEHPASPPKNVVPVYLPLPEQSKASPTISRQGVEFGRKPLIIPGSQQRQVERPHPPVARRMVVHVAVSVLLLFTVVGVLIAVLPVGTDAKEMNSFLPIMHLNPSKSNSTVLIAAQAATATAVTVDGYDPGGHQVYAGVQSAPSSLTSSFSASDAGNLSRFFYGQCTYWANMRYRQLTGHWISWLGNAYQWAYAAPASGWVISSQPNPNGPSIVVLAPYTQGAGSFGHVAVVENAASSPSDGVMTSNWNWLGRWATLDWVRFYPGPGVSFLWYPGS